MTKAVWRRVQEIFTEAEALGPARWPRYLDRECADEPEVRGQVESLLAAHREAGRFLETPADPAGRERLPRGASGEALDPKLRRSLELLRAGDAEKSLRLLSEELSSLGVSLEPSGAGWSALRVRLEAAWFLLLNFLSPAPGRRSLPEGTGTGAEIAASRRQAEAFRQRALALAISRPRRALLCAERQVALAARRRNPRSLAQPLALAAALACWSSGRGRGAGRLQAAALRLARGRGASISDRGFTALTGGVLSVCEGDWKGGLALWNEAQKALEPGLERTAAGVFHVSLLAATGRLAQARSAVPRLLEGCREKGGDAWAEAFLRAGLMSFLHLTADRVEEARAEVAEARRLFPECAALEAWAAARRVELALYRGRGLEAWEGARVLERTAFLLASPSLELPRLSFLSLRARAGLAAASETSGKAARRAFLAGVAEDLGALRRLAHPSAEPFVLLGEAARHRLEGRRVELNSALLEATRLFEARDLRLHAALTRWRRARSRVGGEAALAEAERFLEGQGAARVEGLARLWIPSC